MMFNKVTVAFKFLNQKSDNLSTQARGIIVKQLLYGQKIMVCIREVCKCFRVYGSQKSFVLYRRQNWPFLGKIIIEIGCIVRRFDQRFVRRWDLATFIFFPIDTAEEGMLSNRAIGAFRHPKSVRVTIRTSNNL